MGHEETPPLDKLDVRIYLTVRKSLTTEVSNGNRSCSSSKR
jgi:hypothetical protein